MTPFNVVPLSDLYSDSTSQRLAIDRILQAGGGNSNVYIRALGGHHPIRRVWWSGVPDQGNLCHSGDVVELDAIAEEEIDGMEFWPLQQIYLPTLAHRGSVKVTFVFVRPRYWFLGEENPVPSNTSDRKAVADYFTKEEDDLAALFLEDSLTVHLDSIYVLNTDAGVLAPAAGAHYKPPTGSGALGPFALAKLAIHHAGLTTDPKAHDALDELLGQLAKEGINLKASKRSLGDALQRDDKPGKLNKSHSVFKLILGACWVIADGPSWPPTGATIKDKQDLLCTIAGKAHARLSSTGMRLPSVGALQIYLVNGALSGAGGDKLIAQRPAHS